MNFHDIFISRQHRFSIGVEKEAGRFYISIPVSNGMVDYEEYYELTAALYESLLTDPNAAIAFANRCRRREVDELLIILPGANRGVAI